DATRDWGRRRAPEPPHEVGLGDATNKCGSNPDTGRGRLGHERAVHVPVIDLDQVSALLQTPADLFGDHDRTVPTAGAADRDLHVPVRGFSEDCADHVHYA